MTESPSPAAQAILTALAEELVLVARSVEGEEVLVVAQEGSDGELTYVPVAKLLPLVLLRAAAS